MYGRQLLNYNTSFTCNIPSRAFQRTTTHADGYGKLHTEYASEMRRRLVFLFVNSWFPSFLTTSPSSACSSRLPISFYFSRPSPAHSMEFRTFSRIRLREYFWHRPVNVFRGKINFCLFPFQTNSRKRLSSSIPMIGMRYYVRRVLISLLLLFCFYRVRKTKVYFAKRNAQYYAPCVFNTPYARWEIQ